MWAGPSKVRLSLRVSARGAATRMLTQSLTLNLKSEAGSELELSAIGQQPLHVAWPSSQHGGQVPMTVHTEREGHGKRAPASEVAGSSSFLNCKIFHGTPISHSLFLF